MSTPSSSASPAGAASPSGDGGGTGRGRRSSSPGSPPSASGARSVPALVAAAVLVVVAIGLVLVFGIARPPQLATVTEDPTPSPEASLAWTRWADGGSCLITLDPQGVEDEVGCGYEGQELVAWTDEGIMLLGPGPPGSASIIDPATGEMVGQLDVDPDGWSEPRDSAVHSTTVDGTLTVLLRDSGTELWRVEAPENYRIRDGVLSPDERFVVLVDSADRLLLVPADGSAEPRVWAEVEESWVQPVWEGSTSPTADEG